MLYICHSTCYKFFQCCGLFSCMKGFCRCICCCCCCCWSSDDSNRDKEANKKLEKKKNDKKIKDAIAKKKKEEKKAKEEKPDGLFRRIICLSLGVFFLNMNILCFLIGLRRKKDNHKDEVAKQRVVEEEQKEENNQDEDEREEEEKVEEKEIETPVPVLIPLSPYLQSLENERLLRRRRTLYSTMIYLLW